MKKLFKKTIGVLQRLADSTALEIQRRLSENPCGLYNIPQSLNDCETILRGVVPKGQFYYDKVIIKESIHFVNTIKNLTATAKTTPKLEPTIQLIDIEKIVRLVDQPLKESLVTYIYGVLESLLLQEQTIIILTLSSLLALFATLHLWCIYPKSSSYQQNILITIRLLHMIPKEIINESFYIKKYFEEACE